MTLVFAVLRQINIHVIITMIIHLFFLIAYLSESLETNLTPLYEQYKSWQAEYSNPQESCRTDLLPLVSVRCGVAIRWVHTKVNHMTQIAWYSSYSDSTAPNTWKFIYNRLHISVIMQFENLNFTHLHCIVDMVRNSHHLVLNHRRFFSLKFFR